MPPGATSPTVGLSPTIRVAAGRADDRAVGLGPDRDRAQVGGRRDCRAGASVTCPALALRPLR